MTTPEQTNTTLTEEFQNRHAPAREIAAKVWIESDVDNATMLLVGSMLIANCLAIAPPMEMLALRDVTDQIIDQYMEDCINNNAKAQRKEGAA